jgi:hypothetical protein
MKTDDVRCRFCGKVLRVREGYEGGPILCTGCGTTNTLEPGMLPNVVTPPIRQPLVSDAPAAGRPVEYPAAPAARADEREVDERARSPMLRRGQAVAGNRRLGRFLVYVVLIAAFVGMIRYGYLRWNRSREEKNVADLIALKHEADELAVNGHPQDAFARYDEIEQRFGYYPFTDPQAASSLDEARAHRNLLFDMLLKNARPSAHMTPEESAAARAEASTPMVAGTNGPDGANSPAARPAVPPPAQAAVTPATEPAPVVPTNLHPPAVRTMPLQAGVTDDEIGQSIQRGVDYLIGQFSGGELPAQAGTRNDIQPGTDALCVYALLQAGKTLHDPRLNPRGKFMTECLTHLKAFPLTEPTAVYSRALRASALGLADRGGDDLTALRADVTWLLGQRRSGHFTYNRGSQNQYAWDNSNSQYGVLGVWAGLDAGVEVPDRFWDEVEQHWTTCQLSDGRWGYQMGHAGTYSMTCAGIASLFVAHDNLQTARHGLEVGKDPYLPALQQGLAWLEAEDHSLNYREGAWSPGYNLYALERVGLACGFKRFGNRDWYQILAGDAVGDQQPGGNWGGTIDTAFHLLFLSRGRHPIFMSKLRFTGAWANRPRDLSNLSHFAGRQLEHPLNWQVVDIKTDWTDWTDAPILNLASHEAPIFTDGQIAKLKSFIEAGGLLYTQSDAGSPEFTRFITTLGQRMFPAYAWQDIPANHPLWTSMFKVTQRTPLRCISNGSRLLIVHSPQDISKVWQSAEVQTRPELWQTATNLFIYSVGHSDLKNRLANAHLPEPKDDPSRKLPVARITYDGNWDPEPGAWRRFATWMQYETSWRPVTHEIPMSRLDAAREPFAHLTGAGDGGIHLSAADLRGLRDYVKSGGVVLVDSCGGNLQFVDAVESAVRPLFAEITEPVTDEQPFMAPTLAGMLDVRGPRIREFARLRTSDQTRIDILESGRGCILFSSADITSGLLGTTTWGISGYEPAYATKLMSNLVIWSADRPAAARGP